MPSATQPARTTLIAVTGLSPAVLTETVWALATSTPPVIPDRIVVITTLTGRERIVQQLLADDRWTQFLAALRRRLGRKHAALLDGRLRFGPAQDHLRIIPTSGANATDASDIRTCDDHQTAADFILRTVREFSEEDGNRLIFSVAGGRKTMGALLFSVATLLGRPGDRVTHVLVNEPYENGRFGFLYPGCLIGPDPLPKNAPPPVIELADVPFVPLRRLFARDLGGRIAGYMDLVDRLNEKVSELTEIDSLVLDVNYQTIAVNGGEPLKIGPRAFCLLLAYAHLAKSNPGHQPPISNAGSTAKELRSLYPPEDDTMPWFVEARDLDADAHKSLSDLRRDLASKRGLTKPQIDRIVPGRHRASMELPPEAITIQHR